MLITTLKPLISPAVKRRVFNFGPNKIPQSLSRARVLFSPLVSLGTSAFLKTSVWEVCWNATNTLLLCLKNNPFSPGI